MDKSRWYGRIGIIIALVLAVLVVVFYMNKSDASKDSVEEVKEIEELLGMEKPLLTWSEMNSLIEKYEKEADRKGTKLTEEDIYKQINDEYGLFNAIAYEMDLVIDDRTNKSMNAAIINSLLSCMYYESEFTLNNLEEIKVLPTANVVDFENSVTDSTIRNLKSHVPVIEENFHAILIADTDGFHKGDTTNIGYPFIGEPEAKLTMLNELEVEEKIHIGFSIYLDESIKLGDFIEKAKKIKVSIGDYEAKPIEYQWWRRNPEVLLKKLEGDQEAKDVLAEYYQLESEFAFIDSDFLFSNPLMLYTTENEIDFPPSEKKINVKREDLAGYSEFIEHLKKDKVLLGDTHVEAIFEIDKRALVEEYNNLKGYFLEDYNYIEDYFLVDGHEPPVITVDGVDMKMQVVTDGLLEDKEIYYSADLH